MRILVVALLAALNLAGCSDAGGNGSGTSDSLVEDPNAQEPDLPGLTNAPPLANLTAEVAIGTIPFQANFTLFAVDAEMDELVWSIDFDGDGSHDAQGGFNVSANGAEYDPVLSNFTYTVAGNYTATVVVGDASSESTATLAITATPPVAFPEQPPYSFSGTVTGAWAGSYLAACPSHVFAVVAPMATMTVGITEGTTAPDLDYYVTSPSGQETGRAGFFVVDNLGEPDAVIEAPELGEWNVAVCAGAAAQGTYTITVTFA